MHYPIQDVFVFLYFSNGDQQSPTELGDLRAPGIERKNSSSNLFSDEYPSFSVDYEQKKLLANKGKFSFSMLYS